MKGKIFGVYLVLQKDEIKSKEKKKAYWECECQNCKSIISVRADGLKRLPQSCPNCKNDISGQKFGKLTVLKKTRIDKNGHSYWLCQCECGNQKEIASSNLKQGATLSCGCLHGEILSKLNLEDLTGQKFGKLTILERAQNIQSNKVMWKCKCDCGNETIVQANNLKSGHTTSCGCIRSQGEETITKILLELNIPFKKEYIFSDLPNRRFDFYLTDLQICIEYDGKQHFHFIGTWHQTQKEFEKSIQRDKEKDEYCQKNNIILIRIPYTDLNKLNKNYLLQLIKKSKIEKEE